MFCRNVRPELRQRNRILLYGIGANFGMMSAKTEEAVSNVKIEAASFGARQISVRIVVFTPKAYKNTSRDSHSSLPFMRFKRQLLCNTSSKILEISSYFFGYFPRLTQNLIF